MRVLIPTDGSPEATAAVRTAGRLLRKEENEFLILCVVPEFSGPKADEASKERVRSTYEQRMIRETESILTARSKYSPRRESTQARSQDLARLRKRYGA